jgi:hypothetical protein
VNSVGCLVVAGFLAIGYAVAAIPGGPWLARLARLNIFAALLGLLVIVALFSPIADPMRIAVDSQVSRLAKGAVKAQAFDYGYLRWRSGRFGLDALHKLEHWTGPQAAYVHDKAHATLDFHVTAYTAPVAQDLAENFVVYPSGRTLPQPFLHQNWLHDPDASSLPACLTTAGVGCHAFFLDLAGDGHEEIVVIGADKSGTITGSNGVFAPDDKGVWHLTGRPSELWQCPVVLKALKRGDFSLVPPQAAAREVDIHGTHLPIDRLAQACPN